MKRLTIAALLFLIATVARADTINVGTLAHANDAVQVTAGGMASVTFVVSGTFSATLTPQFSLDGTTWQTATVTGSYPATTQVTTVTGTGTWQVSTSSWGYFRLFTTSYTSGSASVTEYASSAPLSGGAGGGGGGGSVTQGTSPWVVSGTFWPYTLGTQTAANSVPVALPSATITTLTPPAAITGFALEAGHAATIDTSTASTASNTAHIADGTGQARITDGTTISNVSPGTGSQTGQSALQVAATNQVQSFSFSGATNGTAYDISGYKSISVQILGNASANTLTFQTSNDASAPTNWTSLSMIVADGSAGGAVSSTYALTVLKSLQATVCAKFFRVICSSFVSGTTTGTLLFSTMPISSLYMGQAGTWTVQPGNTANTTPWLQTLRPGTAGGNTPFWLDNVAGTVLSIKGTAGQLYNIQVDNSQAATAAFVQIFNVATGSVTLGTTSPNLEYYVPAASTRTISFGDIGTAFGTAISIAATTTDKGLTGSASGVIVSGSFN